ncbi:MAG: hypothetical protein R2760_05885 [Chitinophagales bacterium]
MIKKTKSESSSSAASKGMLIIQPDLNLGDHGGFSKNSGGVGFIPGFTLNVEYGVHDYVSVGGYFGYGARNKAHHIAVGARGTFHWWQLLDDKVSADLKSDKIDFYMPVHLGVYMYMGGGTTARFNGGAGLGFRYYFVDNIGVNMEWGRQEMSWAKIGVQFKL